MRANPLNAPILQIIRAHPNGLSEFELMQRLNFDDLVLDDDDSPDLLLYRKHFLIMNALYRLQELLWEEGELLRISALKVELLAMAPSENSTGLPDQPGDAEIRAYYLDWNEFDASSNASVEALLNSFWQRYLAEDKRSEACQLLGCWS